MRRFGISVLYAAILLAFCLISHFAIVSNDVFPLRWQAEHLSLLHPDTFYDGFFPIGYPLLERVAAATGNPIPTMVLLQIVLAIAYSSLTQRFLEKLVGTELGFVGVPLVLFGPQILTNVLSATPDFLAGFCVLIGLWLLVRRELSPPSTSGRTKQYLNMGIALGFGYLLRTHVIILVLALAVAFVLFEERRVRACVLLLLGSAPFILIQGLVQVWSGHGFFQSSQAFNVWRMMHGSNWTSFPDLAGMSAADVMRSAPTLFLSAWWDQIAAEWLYLIPTVLALLLMFRRGRFRTQRSFAILLLAAILYLLASALGGSPRNVIIVVPIVAAAVMFIIRDIFNIAEWRMQTPGYVAAAALWFLGIVATLIFSFHASRRVQDYREVEHLLNVRNSADAQHIFTDDFDLYFPDFKYATPRTSGGWAEVGLPAYASQYSSIPDSNANALHEALERQDIHWVVVRVPPYDEHGYALGSSDSTLFHLAYATSRHKIYRVE